MEEIGAVSFYRRGFFSSRSSSNVCKYLSYFEFYVVFLYTLFSGLPCILYKLTKRHLFNINSILFKKSLVLRIVKKILGTRIENNRYNYPRFAREFSARPMATHYGLKFFLILLQ